MPHAATPAPAEGQAARVAGPQAGLKPSLNDPEGLVRQALALRDSRPAEAAKYLRRAIRLHPDDTEAYRALAEIYHADNYLDREIETLEMLLQHSPNDPAAVARLSRVYVETQDPGHADALLTKALAAHPTDRGLIDARIAFCYSTRKFAEGTALLSRLVQSQPGDDDGLDRLSEMQRANGQYDDAEKSIRGALKLKPDEGRHLRQLAHILVTSERSDRLADAEAAGRRAVDALPGDEEALYWLALALDRQHKDAEATSCYEKVANIDVRYERTAFRLGRLYQAAGRLEEGDRQLKLYNEMETNRSRMAQAVGLLRNHPERIQNYVQLARVYRLAGEDGVAITLLRRARARFPSDATVPRELAAALKAAGRMTEAKAELASSERSAQ